MTPRNTGRVEACTREEARARRDQARAFLEVAELVLAEGPREAHVAASLAVLSGIASADVICGLALLRWSRGSDHRQAVDLLREVVLTDPTVATKATSPVGRKGQCALLAKPGHQGHHGVDGSPSQGAPRGSGPPMMATNRAAST